MATPEVELARGLRWGPLGVVAVRFPGRRTLHPWKTVRGLHVVRGRWDVLALDVHSAWFDTVPVHLEVELDGAASLRRRLDRDRLLRFAREVDRVDPSARGRAVTAAFLDGELEPLLGRG